MSQHKEKILGWTKLTGKCSTCKSTAVVVRVHSHREYRDPRIISGPQMHDYCAEHSPIDIATEERAWLEYCMTPPGR